MMTASGAVRRFADGSAYYCFDKGVRGSVVMRLTVLPQERTRLAPWGVDFPQGFGANAPDKFIRLTDPLDCAIDSHVRVDSA